MFLCSFCVVGSRSISYLIEVPQRGEHRRPTVVLGAFVAAFVVGGSPSRRSFWEIRVCLEFVRRVLGAFLEVIGRSLDGLLRVLGGSWRNLGGFTTGFLRFSVDSQCICSGFLLILVLATIVLDLLISGGPEGAQNDPRMAKKVATGSPRGIKKQ